jgi:predicted ATPase with chaperone activity
MRCRHVPGVAAALEDVVHATCGTRSGGGLLLIGPPGVGKTTLLRDVAHMLSKAMDREVVIVDTRLVGLQGNFTALSLVGCCIIRHAGANATTAPIYSNTNRAAAVSLCPGR